MFSQEINKKGSTEGTGRETGDSSEYEEVISNVLRLIEEETEIATASKMNVDYVPGMVTILRGGDLEEKGIGTVYEALALVPGLDLSMSGSGEKKIIVRGLGSTFTPAPLKLMLNGVSLNSNVLGKTALLFDIPMAQVERIEIIRGPGAVLYGEYAYAGVINVITRRDGNRAFAGYGSFNTYIVGGMFSLNKPENDFRLALNIAGWDTDGADIKVAEDKLSGSPFEELSRAPGPTNEDHDNITGVLSADYKEFSFLAQYISSKYGDYFGFDGILPEAEGRKVQNYEEISLEARQEWFITPAIGLEFKLGWSRSINDWAAELLPPGFGLGPFLLFPDGLYQDVYYQEERLYGGLNITLTGWETHTMLIGLAYSDADTQEASMETNDQEEAWVDAGTGRRLTSLFAQDEIELNDRLSLTGGVRYDDYDDVGNRLTPRVAAVLRLRDRHILKAQYAEAFRPPNFTEIYGLGEQFSSNPGIDPEIIRTYELGYIYKGATGDLWLTLFYSDLEDLIVIERLEEEEGFQFDNSGGAFTRGAELEVEKQLVDYLRLDANVSYLITIDKETGEELEGSANWLGNAGLLWQPWESVALSAQYRYVGDRHRRVGDDRDDLDRYNTINLTLNLHRLFKKGITFQAGIKNILDEEVLYPARSFTYEDDYLRPGRTWWAQISYEF